MNHVPRSLRRRRKRGHRIFDKLWKRYGMSRSGAYRWLAARLGITSDECHFALFDRETCDQAIALCREVVDQLEGKDL